MYMEKYIDNINIFISDDRDELQKIIDVILLST